MRILFCVLASVLIVSCNTPSETSSVPIATDSVAAVADSAQVAENPAVKVEMISMKGTSEWKGSIDGKIGITMTLSFNGETVLGTLTYKASGKPITILGYRDEQNNVVLQEYYKSQEVTGVYMGLLYQGDSISGSWYGGDYDFGFKIQKTFVLKKTKDLKDEFPPITQNVTGSYAFHYQGENGAGGTLMVAKMKDSIAFNFSCVTPGPAFNMAYLTDTVKFENNHVYYERSFYDDPGYGPCKFEIFFVPGGAFVRHASDGYECGFGHNASVDGLYFKTSDTEPKIPKDYESQ